MDWEHVEAHSSDEPGSPGSWEANPALHAVSARKLTWAELLQGRQDQRLSRRDKSIPEIFSYHLCQRSPEKQDQQDTCVHRKRFT